MHGTSLIIDLSSSQTVAAKAVLSRLPHLKCLICVWCAEKDLRVQKNNIYFSTFAVSKHYS